MRIESFKKAENQISRFICEHSYHGFSIVNLRDIFYSKKEEWKIAEYRNVHDFINFLIKEDILIQLKLSNEKTIYIKPGFNNYNISKAIKKDESKKSKWQTLTDKDLIKKTWKQFLSFAPYIAIGIAIGAFVHGFVPNEVLKEYAGRDNPFAIPFSALIGIPLYIRASSMVGLAPALLDGGVSMGAILALTVAGAGASLPEMIMLKKIFKLPIMIFFLVSVFTMAIACGYLVNLYFA